VFTDPQVASVGHTEAAARALGLAVRTVEYDIGSVAGASLLADGYRGRAKLVVDEDRKVVVGATFVGQDVAELLHSATVAVVGAVPLADLWHAVPSYPTVSVVSRHVAAAPAVVWRLVGDPTRMGEWSPEAVAQAWLGGATGPAVGARFRGRNRNGRHRWSTVCTVVAWTPEREVAWDVETVGLATARWSYRLLPDGDGTLLVEEFTDHRGPLMKVIGVLGRGVADVETHNRGTMIVTLERIARAAERHAGADTAMPGPTTAPS
jgi:hypothetical protein